MDLEFSLRGGVCAGGGEGIITFGGGGEGGAGDAYFRKLYYVVFEFFLIL